MRSYDSASATYCKGRHEVNSFSAPVFLLRFVHQFKITLKAFANPSPVKITPKAFANFSPGFERSENPGTLPNDELKPCKGSSQGEPFQGSALVSLVYPGLSLALQPWAGISERLRRNLTGLGLANAFGVIQTDTLPLHGTWRWK